MNLFIATITTKSPTVASDTFVTYWTYSSFTTHCLQTNIYIVDLIGKFSKTVDSRGSFIRALDDNVTIGCPGSLEGSITNVWVSNKEKTSILICEVFIHKHLISWKILVKCMQTILGRKHFISNTCRISP